MKTSTAKRWAVLWRCRNGIDGFQPYFLWDVCAPLLFVTRAKALAYIRQKYGYIALRPDLRAEPHGWRMPLPVRVNVTVAPCQ